MKKKILYALLFAFVVIQFIRPEKNIAAQASPNDIVTHYDVPDQVLNVLKRSCYDCHSNNTQYPWYYNVQPVAWWLDHHIRDGKRHLNFSEFNQYSFKRKNKKMEEVAESVTEGWMPLNSYLWIHTNAKLSDADAKAVADWAKAMQKKIMTDSLRSVKTEVNFLEDSTKQQ
jgi:hypothetical protein